MFFKSINLVTSEYMSSCELSFRMLQFKIHLNLKSDEDFYRFYEKCKLNLDFKANTFKHNYQTCLPNFKFEQNLDIQTKNISSMHESLITDALYWIIMLLLLGLLGPYLGLIIALRFVKAKAKQSANKSETFLSENSDNKEQIDAIMITNITLSINIQKSIHETILK